MNLYTLEPGVVYRVTKPFLDYYQNCFAAGETLTFVERHFLPYHGGHTIVFKEKSLYLQEDENAQFISTIDQYIEPYDLSGRIPPPVAPVDTKSKKGDAFTAVGSLLLGAAGIWMVFFGGNSNIERLLGCAAILLSGLSAFAFRLNPAKRGRH